MIPTKVEFSVSVTFCGFDVISIPLLKLLETYCRDIPAYLVVICCVFVLFFALKTYLSFASYGFLYYSFVYYLISDNIVLCLSHKIYNFIHSI
jgi:hypothetical protein